jgi:two-component system OmpR family sensor kinase
MTSIRRQLLVGLLAVVVIVGLVAAWGVYQRAYDELSELLDYQLRQMALSLRELRAVRERAVGIQREFRFCDPGLE